MPPLRPSSLIVAAAFCFALMAVFTRNAGAPIMAVAAWRSVVVALSFGAWALAVHGPQGVVPRDPKVLRLAAIYGLALALASATFVGGYAFTTVANTIFLHNLAPAVALPLAWWMFGERATAATITGVAIAVVGVAMLSGVTLFHGNPRYMLGDFLAILSAVGYGAVVVLTRATRRAETPIVPTLFVAWSVAAVVLVVVAALTSELDIPGTAVPWIVGLGLLSTTVPFYLLNLGMRHVTASHASVLGMSEVLFATLVGVLVFGENMAPIAWFGGALVVLGVVYPFLAQGDVASEPSDTDPLDPATLPWRLARLAVALALTNGGALLAVLGGSEAGLVLAWIGMIHLLRLGLAPLSGAFDHRFPRGIRWAALALATGLALGLLFRTRTGGAESLAPYALALGALLVDRSLARRETEGWRDPLEVGALALGLVVLAGVADAIGHPARAWLVSAAAALGLVEAAAIALAAARGDPVHAGRPDRAGLSRADHGVARIRPTLALAVLGAVYLIGGITLVPAGHQAVITRFGQPIATHAPGLSVRLPPPFERSDAIHTSLVRRVALFEANDVLLSGDQSMVALQGAVQYRVVDPILFYVHSDGHDEILGTLARAALIRTVGQAHIDSLLTDARSTIAADALARTALSAKAIGLGLEVLSIDLTDVRVPAQVSEAFLDVISAAEEKNTAINRAEAYAAELIPETSGEGAAVQEAAHGEAASITARGEAAIARLERMSPVWKAAPALVGTLLRASAFDASLDGKRVVLTRGTVPVWLEPKGQPVSVPAKGDKP